MITILFNIRGLHNVGSIFRTANAVGVEKIYLAGITPTPRDRFGLIRSKFGKVALGPEKDVPWEYLSSARMRKKIHVLKENSYSIFAVEQDKKSIPYFKLSKKFSFEKIALVFGNEIKGWPPSILKIADKILEIPMNGKMIRQADHPRCTGRGKESLNVSVAFGVVSYGIKYKKNG